MKRWMLSAYVRESDNAVELYKKAFGAKIVDSYLNDDGTYYHCELDVYGQILAVAERLKTQGALEGTTMQYCLHFDLKDETEAKRIFEVLKDGAKVHFEGSTEYSPWLVDLTDKYGIRWCVFVT